MTKSFFGVAVYNEINFENGRFLEAMADEACVVRVDNKLPKDQRIPHIILNTNFESILSEEELEAVLLHEVGHLVAGHGLERSDLNSLQCELEADAYAVRQGVPVEVMLSAFYKTAWWYADKIQPGIEGDERCALAMRSMTANSERAARLEALMRQLNK